MNEQDKKELKGMIITLFATRNQIAGIEVIAAWGQYLKEYDIDSLKEAFTNQIKYGDNFPSLPAIIKQIEKRPDIDTSCVIAWKNVFNAAKECSSKNLSQIEKKTLSGVVSGLTEYIESDSFKKGQIERDFKKLYAAEIQGLNNKQIETGNLKKLGIDTSLIGNL